MTTEYNLREEKWLLPVSNFSSSEFVHISKIHLLPQRKHNTSHYKLTMFNAV